VLLQWVHGWSLTKRYERAFYGKQGLMCYVILWFAPELSEGKLT
jgi:hypothetical protein